MLAIFVARSSLRACAPAIRDWRLGTGGRVQTCAGPAGEQVGEQVAGVETDHMASGFPRLRHKHRPVLHPAREEGAQPLRPARTQAASPNREQQPAERGRARAGEYERVRGGHDQSCPSLHARLRARRLLPKRVHRLGARQPVYLVRVHSPGVHRHPRLHARYRGVRIPRHIRGGYPDLHPLRALRARLPRAARPRLPPLRPPARARGPPSPRPPGSIRHPPLPLPARLDPVRRGALDRPQHRQLLLRRRLPPLQQRAQVPRRRLLALCCQRAGGERSV
ncbi:hypothetical protein CALVIDRAFT_30863 [Calocera viscosa TUFC12733]|uniref:Uncharacterized protein n=1 Tax=Calocera viscosa (strain TUFC12733) TaxID=1330018 RepID=A0A167PDB8_CALVF|nr:hypothetical protein CALVIDRAFT_30863 [Calocera viscosa TUFC12733]